MDRKNALCVWTAGGELLAALVAAVGFWGCGLGGPTFARAENGAAEKAPDDEDRQISRLIAELGDNRFVVRQRAQRELTRLGAAAFDSLSAAEDSDDVEIATQCVIWCD